RVAELHLLARFYGQRRYLAGVNARHKLVNAGGNLHAVLVEFVLPEHAGEYGAPQRLLRRQHRGGSALVGAWRNEMTQFKSIQTHVMASFQDSITGCRGKGGYGVLPSYADTKAPSCR